MPTGATDFGAITEARKIVWYTMLYKQMRDQSFFMSKNFVGTGFNSPVQKVTELTADSRGTSCVMQLVNDAEGDGVAGDERLDGNEEKLTNGVQTINIDMISHAFKSEGKMSEQATVIRFREQAKDKLGFWLPDKIDELMFLTVSGRAYTLKTDLSTRGTSRLPALRFASDVAAPSTNRIMYAGSATSEATLTASDKMSWDFIVRSKTYAKRQKLPPIRQGGKEYVVIVMSPEQSRDLVLDPTYQTIVSRAAEKGFDNPLFSGAMAVVHGVVLYDHNKVINTSGLGSGAKWGAAGTVEGAQATLLGASALGMSMIGGGEWKEKKDDSNYGRQPGIAVEQMLGLLKPQFKTTASATTSEDYGCIALKTAAAL